MDYAREFVVSDFGAKKGLSAVIVYVHNRWV